MLHLIGVLFDGVGYGMLLFLLAIGLSVTMGLMGFVNLAHPAFAMLGGYAFVVLTSSFGWPFAAAIVAAACLAGVVGIILESLLFRRMYSASALEQVLMTVGLIFVASSAATFFFGANQQLVTVPEALRGQLHVGPLELSTYRLVLICIGAVLSVVLVFSLERTNFGAKIRAAVDNRVVASAMGIRVNSLFCIVFGLGCCLAGAGGALGVEVFGLDPSFPFKYLVYCLLVVVVGGTGSVLGTLYASLLVGIADVVGKYYFPEAGAFTVYALMVVLLVCFPAGLKGRVS